VAEGFNNNRSSELGAANGFGDSQPKLDVKLLGVVTFSGRWEPSGCWAGESGKTVTEVAPVSALFESPGHRVIFNIWVEFPGTGTAFEGAKPELNCV
jgi:hypothetical protein